MPLPFLARTCYGQPGANDNEYIRLFVSFPEGQAPNPQVFGSYLTSRHGGMKIVWRTPIRNFSKWKEIDTQIWKFMDSWLAAGESATVHK